MNVNTKAIEELRKGAVGDELAQFEIACAARQARELGPKDALGEAHHEIGALRASLRKVCGLLEDAVKEPEPEDDLLWLLRASIARHKRHAEEVA